MKNKIRVTRKTKREKVYCRSSVVGSSWTPSLWVVITTYFSLRIGTGSILYKRSFVVDFVLNTSPCRVGSVSDRRIVCIYYDIKLFFITRRRSVEFSRILHHRGPPFPSRLKPQVVTTVTIFSHMINWQ